MSSTTVHSNNNQVKTNITGMGIVFNTREKQYEIQVGQTINTVSKDHIQEQGAIGIALSTGKVNEKNQIEKADGSISKLSNPNAFLNIQKHVQEKSEKQDKAKHTEMEMAD